ncbi:hypothetical protein BpHYR1_025655 [Brachionus plicatilis]|uniref:Uncharacterized protein n=1 Tax=Brachionus plicatilis TaxID=10195 RepID=A0A3M7SUK7_BRAPC|nr:hypothetical protein BpHYR1_025655 [Brachionus plicatilis]
MRFKTGSVDQVGLVNFEPKNRTKNFKLVLSFFQDSLCKMNHMMGLITFNLKPNKCQIIGKKYRKF